MAFYGLPEKEHVRAQIRSTRGETIDLSVPITCTLGELRRFLIDEYDYSPDTRLLFNNRLAPDAALVNDYPYGSLVITNAPPTQPLPPRQAPPLSQQPQFQQRPTYPTAPQLVPAAPAPPQTPVRRPVPSPSAAPPTQPKSARAKEPSPPLSAAAAGAPPPLPSPTAPAAAKEGGASARSKRTSPQREAAAAHTPQGKGVRSSHEGRPDGGSGGRQGNARRHSRANSNASRNGSNGNSSANGAATPSEDAVPEKAPWQLATFTVECVIPDLGKTVALQVNGDASVADLVLAVVATLPEVAGGSKVIYRGKVLPQTPESKLFNLGIRADAKVFFASGKYTNPDTITLLEIENEVDAIGDAIESKQLTDLERKGYYENLMRILFRTDGLMELEGEWRQRRKDAVAHIKRLQDTLHPEGDS